MNFDDIKNKAEDLLQDHKYQVEDGVEKASDLLKDKVGHDDQVEKAEGFLKDKLGNL